MLEIEESAFCLGLYGKLPSADLISWFGEDCIDLKQQTKSGHGQRVSDREKKSEITAKATITQLKKEHQATVARLKKEHQATVAQLKKNIRRLFPNLKKSIKMQYLPVMLKSKSLSPIMPTCSICYLVAPQRRKANPNKVIRSSRIKVRILHDSRSIANVVISQEPRGAWPKETRKSAG